MRESAQVDVAPFSLIVILVVTCVRTFENKHVAIQITYTFKKVLQTNLIVTFLYVKLKSM